MLILVRHGRTAANASGLLLGRADPPLDELGTDQAEAVARTLRSEERSVRDVVASPLLRTRMTAEQLTHDVAVDGRWVELSYGEWERRPLADVPAATWQQWRSDPDFAPPGGESIADLGRRVRAACDDLVEAARDHDVVVVSHVSPIKAAVAWALGVPDEVAWHLFLAPASITRIRLEGSRRVLQSYNETAHLADVDTREGPAASP